MSARYYIFPENEAPQRIPLRVVNDLIHDTDSLPQFANTKQRVLSAYLEMDGRRPVRIWRTEGSIWAFDEDGCIGTGLRKGLALAMDSLPVPPAADNVVSINPQRTRKKLREEHRWEPTSEHIERIVADIWPKKASDKLKIVKGTAEPRLSLTFEARHALDRCSEGFWKIDSTVSVLAEPSLKSLAYHARRRATEPGDGGPLYRAVAEIADWHRELASRKKTGKGTWYAVLEVLIPRERNAVEISATYSEKCDGREAAALAARKLVTDHADKITAYSSIHMDVITDLEWQREGYSDR